MGLRSPQQLEQVQVGVPNVPTVEAGKVSAIDLATPVNNFMEQKAVGDQIDSVNKIVVSRKDSLAKIKSKYAVESVTSEFKTRLASLVGDNAVTKSQGLVDQATRAIEELQQKAPADLADQVARDSQIKIKELRELMTDKISTEGRKSAIDTGNANTKVLTLEAMSTFEDIDTFKQKYISTMDMALHTEEMKGGSKNTKTFNAIAVGSNAVYEGVKFSLALKVTPDKVEELSKYFEEVILKDGDIKVNEDDQNKIRDAFTAAKTKSEDDLGYMLAAEAFKRAKEDPRFTEEDAQKYMFENGRGSGKSVTQAFGLYRQLDTARKAELEQKDRGIFAEVQKLVDAKRPLDAAQLSKQMTPGGKLAAWKYLDAMEGGTANAFSNPKDREYMEKLWAKDEEAASKVPINSLQYSRADKRAEEQRRRVYGRKVQDKVFAISAGSGEAKAEKMGMQELERVKGYAAKTNVKMRAQAQQNTREIYYQVLDEYPELTGEKNEAVVLGMVRERMKDPEKGILKGISEPNIIGKTLGLFGVNTTTKSWANTDKVEARPTDEFKSTRQTGGKDKVRVPEPTADEIRAFRDEAQQDGGDNLTEAQAREIMLKLRRTEKARTQ